MQHFEICIYLRLFNINKIHQRIWCGVDQFNLFILSLNKIIIEFKKRYLFPTNFEKQLDVSCKLLSGSLHQESVIKLPYRCQKLSGLRSVCTTNTISNRIKNVFIKKKQSFVLKVFEILIFAPAFYLTGIPFYNNHIILYVSFKSIFIQVIDIFRASDISWHELLCILECRKKNARVA